ncbi:glycosyltransferase [Rarobacter incanus]|nr:glycosyltransferase [Rarobacter incanus]
MASIDKRSVGYFIAVSNYVKSVAIQSGMPEDRIVTRPNLYLRRSNAVRKQISMRSNRIAFVGRATPEKGLDDLIRAFLQLVQWNSNLVLAVIGPARGAIDHPNIEYLGQIDHQQVTRELSHADCAVVPSLWPEPFGRVVIEALGEGTPVVVSSIGGLAELAGPGVLAYRPGSVGDLVEKINSSISLPRELAFREALARFDADFSAENWYETTMGVISDATSNI